VRLAAHWSGFAKRSAGAIAEWTRDQARRVETQLYRGLMRSTPGAVFGGCSPKMAPRVAAKSRLNIFIRIHA